MNISEFSDTGLKSLYDAVRDALTRDDECDRTGKTRIHRVRDTNDWRTWSDALAREMDARGIRYDSIRW